MEDKIRQAITITASTIWPILLILILFTTAGSTIYLLNISGKPAAFGATSLILLVLGLAVILLNIIIYGRIAARITGRMPGTVISMLSEHSCNYIVTSLLIYLPLIILFLIFLKMTGSSTEEARPRLFVISLAIQLITIYVMPYVFIQHQRLNAIKSGIRFFFTHIRLSIPLILTVFVVQIMYKAGYPSNIDSLGVSGSTRFIISVLLNLVSFVVFALATLILQEHNEFEPVSDGSGPVVETQS